MASSTQADAERKFWQVPELVEKLLEHLDASATLELAEVHRLTLQILQGDSGTLKPFKKVIGLIGQQLGQDTFEQQRVMVERVVVAILAKMEKPEPLLVELLDVICAEHKTDAIAIQLTCPCPASPHSVSSVGFILLEDCEGALGSAEQHVKRISWDDNLDNFLTDPLLFALTFGAGGQLAPRHVLLPLLGSGRSDAEGKTRGSEVYLGCRGQRPLEDRRVVDCAEGDGGRQFCNGGKVLQKRVGQAEEREELERACQILGGSQGEAKLLFMFISFLRR